MDIIEFLEARIAEDEDAARDASHRPSLRPDVWEFRPREGGEAFGNRVLEHIARLDPTRALAECKAKRAIIDAIRRQEEDDDPMAWIVASGILLKTMAAVYAEHKDYAPMWAQ